MVLESIITCPKCDHKQKEQMPTNACQWFYKCKNCNEILKPKQGDCCIFETVQSFVSTHDRQE